MTNTCESCGARLEDGADQCGLCGTDVSFREGVVSADLDGGSGEEHDSDGNAHQEVDSSAPSAGTFCNACGWKNPHGANFCAKCGSALQKLADRPAASKKKPVHLLEVVATTSKKKTVHLQEVSATSSSTAKPSDSQGAVGKQIIIIVASALLVVIALYMVTTMSKEANPDSATVLPLNPGVEEPLASQFVPRETELTNKLESASGDSLVAIRRELVNLYFAAGRFDLAAAETERIATLIPTENEWAVAGNLYYDWMERKDPTLRAPWAQKAVAAYKQVLEINPLNLDVRTDMAIAYMYDPQNSMLAIQETNAVLEQDSLHMQANFNKGIMLMQINRNVQAAEQFERVMELIGDPADPVYIRAQQLAERLRSEASAGA